MYDCIGRPGGAVQVDGARCAGREEVLLQQRDSAERLGEAAGAHRLPGLHLGHILVDPYVFGPLLDPSLFFNGDPQTVVVPSVADPGPSDRIRMFLDLLDPDPLVRGTDPDSSINKQNKV